MHSIIKNVKATDIRKLSISDFEEALFYVNSTREKIRNLSDNVRKIILWIIELSKIKKIDISEKELWNKLIESLRNSDELLEIWLWKLVSEIIFNNPDLEKLAFYDQETWLPNRFKLKEDIENWTNNNKVVILLKVEWVTDINNICGHDCWAELLKAIINSLKLNFENVWFKIYRESWITFWLIRDSDSTNSYEEIIVFINNFIKNYYIESANIWKISIPSKVVINIGEWIRLENLAEALEIAKVNDILTLNNINEIELKNKLIEKDKWRKEVEDALNTWRIIPYYQWIYDNNSKKITKYEALLRLIKWNEVFPPWIFLKHINWTSLMKRISKTIIISVIKKMKNSNCDFSINLTETDLIDENILNLIKKELIENQVDPSRLTIEILEEVWVYNGMFIMWIRKIKELWLKIAIDDFWTGYSWFQRIYESNPEYIKIDWTLINWIVNDEKKRGLVESIVRISNILWAKVIAEYVENKEIQEIIEKLNIDYSQWYLFSIPSKEIEK